MAIDYSILGMPFQRQAKQPTYSQSVQQGLGTYKDLSKLYHEGQKRQKLSALGQTLKGEFDNEGFTKLGALAEVDPQGAMNMYQAMQKSQGASAELAKVFEAIKAKEAEMLSKIQADPNAPLAKDKMELFNLINDYNSKSRKSYKSAFLDSVRQRQASENSAMRRESLGLGKEKFAQQKEEFEYKKGRDVKKDEMEERKYQQSEEKFAQQVKQYEEGQEAKAEAQATPKANLYNASKKLAEAPDDLGARANALLLILRKESGAAIGQDEFLSRASSFLSGEDYKAMQDDVLGFENWAVGMVRDDGILQAKMLKKYLPKMNPLGMRKELLSMVGESRDILEKRSKELDKELGLGAQPNDNDLLNELEGL